MQSIQNFIFEDQAVQVVLRSGKPWFVAAHVCRILDIKNVAQAVENLDQDEKSIINLREADAETALSICSAYGTSDRGGNPNVIVVSEGGLYTLVLRSRKAVTPGTVEHRFRKWVTGVVIPQIREAGSYGMPQAMPVPANDLGADPHASPFYEKLQAVRLCLKVYGRARAQVLWQQLGLPAVPPPPPSEQDEAHACLRHLLDAPVHGDGPSVASSIEAALEDDEEARLLLLPVGIRPYPDRDVFLVANSHPGVNKIYATTRWGMNRYIRVLRRLYGVEAGGIQRFLPPSGQPGQGRGIPHRGTLIPADYLDERYRARADSTVQI